MKNESNGKPRLKASKLLIKVGGTAWVLMGGLAVMLIALHQLGTINAWQFLWKPRGVFLGCGGFACFMTAWILEIWEPP